MKSVRRAAVTSLTVMAVICMQIAITLLPVVPHAATPIAKAPAKTVETPIATCKPKLLTGLHPESGSIGREYADANLPKFHVYRGQDHSRERCCCWERYKPLELPGKPAGQNLPQFAQETGDCASWACCHAIEENLLFQIASGDWLTFLRPYQPWAYGLGRVQIGKNGLRGEGAVIAYVLQGLQEYGILCYGDPGVPEYRGQVSDDWGRGRGPPQQFFEIAKNRRLKTFARLETIEQVIEALGNFYPVVIGDPQFAEPQCREVAGRIVAEWSQPVLGGHAMCVIGYDGTGPEAYFYILNSHGENAVPKPLNGEPPGGFWVSARFFARILRGIVQRRYTQPGEAWAASQVDGFPAVEIRIEEFPVFKVQP